MDQFKATFFQLQGNGVPYLGFIADRESVPLAVRRSVFWMDWTGREGVYLLPGQELHVSERRELFFETMAGFDARRWPHLVPNVEVTLNEEGRPTVSSVVIYQDLRPFINGAVDEDSIGVDDGTAVPWPQMDKDSRTSRAALVGGEWTSNDLLEKYLGQDVVIGLSPDRGIAVIISNDGDVLWSAGTSSAKKLISAAKPVLARTAAWREEFESAKGRRMNRLQALMAEGVSLMDAAATADAEGLSVPEAPRKELLRMKSLART